MTDSICTKPQPTNLIVHARSRVLELSFDDGSHFLLPVEFLRVYSPSAEVRGHAPEEEILQTGKREVGMTAVEPVGNYGIKPVFSDGHDSGIYSWEYLHRLGSNQNVMGERYLQRLEEAGFTRESGRDAPMQTTGNRCRKN